MNKYREGSYTKINAIKLQGTNFDRRRKLNLEDIPYITFLHNQGMSYAAIGRMYNVSGTTVKCYIYPEWREHQNFTRYKNNHINYVPKNTLDYKRQLVRNGLVSI